MKAPTENALPESTDRRGKCTQTAGGGTGQSIKVFLGFPRAPLCPAGVSPAARTQARTASATASAWGRDGKLPPPDGDTGPALSFRFSIRVS